MSRAQGCAGATAFALGVNSIGYYSMFLSVLPQFLPLIAIAEVDRRILTEYAYT